MSGGGEHLLVIDDDGRIRDLLRRYLARNGYLVTVARDAEHARRLLQGLQFDLMVVDVMLPGEDGFALTGSLRAQTRTPILLLSARGAPEDRIRGLELGADDYLPKPFEPQELLLRVNAILRRAPAPPLRPAPPRSLHLGPVRYDAGRGELWYGTQLVHLTTTEGAILRVLAAAPHQPVARLDLVAELGRGGADIQERAIDVQITRLRRKLEPDPRRPRYLQTVRGSGYMLVPD